VFDDIRDFGRANLRFEKFLEFGTIDVRRKTADKEFALLKFFGVLRQPIFLQLWFAFDRTILEHMILEGQN
jgi:hypothetical protein